jgi:hypothetical protein
MPIKITVAGLAQFMNATSFRQRRLLRDHKFPYTKDGHRKPQIVRYSEARSTIQKYRVFADRHTGLPAAVRTEADVIDAFFVVFRFAIDHRVLRLEATLGLVNGLAERAFTVLGDADVQRCGTVCHEILLNPILRDKEISRF